MASGRMTGWARTAQACPEIQSSAAEPGDSVRRGPDARLVPFPFPIYYPSMKAIQVARVGGPEVLTLVDLPVPVPKPHEALVQIEAVGVNFIDVYFREGRYPAPLPFINGQEASGLVVAVGPDVTTLRLGDRVAYTSGLGSYAEYAAVPAERLIKIPDQLDSTQAAAA